MDWAYGRWKYDCRNLGLLEDEDIVLDLAALQIASLDHPRHSSSGLIDMLTGMAVELARIVTPEHTTARQAIALEGVFVRRGFRGAIGPHIRSADIFRVLATRQGAPLPLAILYIATARRAGLTAVLMDTLTGVLIRLGSEEGDAVFAIDAAGRFDWGTLNKKDRDEGPRRAEMTNRMTLVRLLETEADIVEMQDDNERALALRSRICDVAPTTFSAWINKARVSERHGRPLDAKECYISALETTIDPFLRHRVQCIILAKR
jgi:regulator of sirC expression with transglutaminase-like and TPR domain